MSLQLQHQSPRSVYSKPVGIAVGQYQEASPPRHWGEPGPDAMSPVFQSRQLFGRRRFQYSQHLIIRDFVALTQSHDNRTGAQNFFKIAGLASELRLNHFQLLNQPILQGHVGILQRRLWGNSTRNHPRPYKRTGRANMVNGLRHKELLDFNTGSQRFLRGRPSGRRFQPTLAIHFFRSVSLMTINLPAARRLGSPAVRH